MSRAQSDWEATRAIVQASIVAAIRDFVSASPGTRSMRVEADGPVVLVHDDCTSRWWVDPERSFADPGCGPGAVRPGSFDLRGTPGGTGNPRVASPLEAAELAELESTTPADPLALTVDDVLAGVSVVRGACERASGALLGARKDHGNAFRGDACIDAAVVSYLVDLDLPAKGTTCE